MDPTRWIYFDVEWGHGDFGGHMPHGFDLDTEMEPIELSERTSDALFEEWATGTYSSCDDRTRSMQTLLVGRIGVRVPSFIDEYLAHLDDA